MKLPTKASPPDSNIICAGEATFMQPYKSLTVPPILVVMKGFVPSGEVLLDAFQPTHNEWRPVKVPKDYKLRTLKEGEHMPTASHATKKAASAKNSVKAKGATSGKTVYEVWGSLFAKHGASPNAPALIVQGMKLEFPGRKTNWAKWVNAVRTLYNRGDKRLGVTKPITPLKPYKANGKASGKK